MKAQSSVEQKLTRARTQLLLNQPFFGTLCLRLKLMPGSRPTLATDGVRIVYNPSFVDSLTPAELEGCLAHEVLHCALGHHARRGAREPRLWNHAADYAINPILVKNGLKLPAGVLLDSQYENLSAEEIYARLTTDGNSGGGSQPNPGAGSGNGSPGNGQPQPDQSSPSTAQNASPGGGSHNCGAHGPEIDPSPGGIGEVLDATDEDGDPASPAEMSRQQHEWSIAAEQAMRMAKACGTAPADLERPLSESRQSQQDWRAILRTFVAATTVSDYRWTPPNRRHIGAGLYLPSVVRSGVGEIVIGVDTSGSIGKDELEQFAGEITAISDEAQPEAIHVVYCDTAVQSAQQFGPSEPIHLEPRGGGGTDFRPVFEWVQRSNIAPVCLIYLTDLCCNSYPEVPEYPVLWVTDSRTTAPFGETVRISVDRSQLSLLQQGRMLTIVSFPSQDSRSHSALFAMTPRKEIMITENEEKISLYYNEGRSDKVYRLQIEQTEGGFIVNFQFGRRGSTLQSGTKTSAPVPYEKAKNIYDRLVAEKKGKGYTQDQDGTPYQNSEQAGQQSGLLPQLLNPIDEARIAELIAASHWCMQEKKDGCRLLVCKSGDVIEGINRKGMFVGMSSAIEQAVREIGGGFVLDGEAIGDIYWVFDLLELDREDLHDLSVVQRFGKLSLLLEGCSSDGALRLIPDAWNPSAKQKLFECLKAERAEGVVFKDMGAKYLPGRPTSGGDHLKFKFTATATCNVLAPNEGKRSVALGVYQHPGDGFVEIGNVTIPANFRIPATGSLVEVRYLYAYVGGSLFQPGYLGERNDVDGADSVKSLKFKQGEDDES